MFRVLLFSLALTGWAWGDTAAPLTLEALLAAVDERVPQLAAAAAKQQIADAKALAAQGAFDPTLSSALGTEQGGPYPFQTLDAALEGVTRPGLEYSLAYRRGVGDFPLYYGELETPAGGELSIGLAAPLLRGLGMTPERAALLAAQTRIDLAAADRDEVRRRLRLQAALDYLRWVQAGQVRDLALEQLALAEARIDAIARSVALGGMARIDLIDSQRVLLERQGAQIAAEQTLQVAATTLSLWYRDEDGAPQAILPSQLPNDVALTAPVPLDPREDAARAWTARPDLRVTDALLEVALIEARAAQAARRPDLSLAGTVSQEVLGTSALAAAPVELEVQLQLEAPLLNRKARGTLQAAQADVVRLEAERQALRDSVVAELTARAIEVTATWERLQRAEQSLAAAREVAALERRSFELGEGDLFRLVLREEAVARDAREAISARFAYRAAQIAYAAAAAGAVDF